LGAVQHRCGVALAYFLVALSVAYAGPDLSRTDWTRYLSGAEGRQLRSAVEAIAMLADESRVAASDRYTGLEALYVRAREEALSVEEYAAELQTLGMGSAEAPERVLLEEMTQHLQLIEAAIILTPPIPGTVDYAHATLWLTAVNEARGEPLGSLPEYIEVLRSVLIDAPESVARDYLSGLAIDTAFLPEAVLANEAAAIAVQVWWLRFLSATDTQRDDMLRSHLELIEDVDGEIAQDGRSVVSALLAERRQRAAATPSPRVGSAVSAFSFSSPDELPGATAIAFRIWATRLRQFSPDELTDVANHDLDCRFVIDMLEHLLRHSSDLALYELGVAVDLSVPDLRRLRNLAIYVDSVAEPGDGSPSPGSETLATEPPEDRSAALEDMMDEGRTYLRSAARWADSDEARSGDAFRWSMLPVLNNPYAQYLLVTDDRYAATLGLVQAFVTETYQDATVRAERSPVPVFEFVTGIHSSDPAVLPFDRVYRIRDNLVGAERLYAAFAAAGQGAEELPAGFEQRYEGSITVAGWWSHSYGLHVVPSLDGADGEEALAGVSAEAIIERLRAYSLDWFTLARVADTEPELLVYLYRGIAAVASVVDGVVNPLLVAGGVVDPGNVAPVLARCRELFAMALDFRFAPDWATTQLIHLAGGDSETTERRFVPSASETDEIFQLIAEAVEAAAFRVLQIEAGDREILMAAYQPGRLGS
jgi:hypothetical protein